MGVTSPRVNDTFFEEVTAVITECVISFERGGAIVFVNRAAEESLGSAPGELLDRSIEELVPAEQLLTFTQLRNQVAVEKERATGELSLRHENELEVPVCITISLVESDGQELFIANYRERSVHVERTEYEERLAAINEANRRFAAAETPTEIARTVIDVVETVLERSLAAVWLGGDDGSDLRAVAVSEGTSGDSDTDRAESPDSITPEMAEMTSYEDETMAVLSNYGSLENTAHPELGLEARLVAPLGKHGLLTVGSTDADDLNVPLQELIDILAKNARVAFDRLESERLIRQQSGAIDAAIDGMAITDEDGVFTYMNDVHAELLGYETADVFIGRSWKRLFGAAEIARIESSVLPAVREHGSWRGEAAGKCADGSETIVEMTLSALDDGGTVCIVRDISDRKSQERQLESLNAVARKLIKSDDSEEIYRIGIEAVEDVLGFENACLRLFDTDSNRLTCVVSTDGAQALLETHTAYDLEATLAGHAFRSGEMTVNSPPSDRLSHQQTTSYSSFHVPLGEYGVISVILQRDEEISDRDVRLSEMLAVNVRTAIARAERARLLETHEREARQQRDQLETLYRINTLVQEIGRRLIEATTREELERTVCDHLVNSDLYHSAWIGDIEATTDRVTTRIGSGITDRDLEAINEMSISSIGNGSVEQMIETDSVGVVRHYQLDGQSSETDSDDPVEGVLSTGAIPLTYGDRLLGVLVVNGTGEDVFGEEAINGFESLGKVIGFSINAIRNRTLLLSDSVIELEFVVSDTQLFFLEVSAELDCECRFERAVPIESRQILNYHTITGADPEPVLEIAAACEQIEDVQVLSESDESFVLQTLTSESISHIALQSGATLRSARAADGEVHVVLEAPTTANVREIVSLIEESFDRVDLLAKREHDRSIETADKFRQALDGALTEKQRSSLESAYASGYYDWPRAITAEELADSMGISSSTLHQHLRKGLWNLLSAYLEEGRE
ncbi:bacterio-opsin activator domain-containing protein [Halostagnicola sp. A-GB9-2]|uniref:bacterio-opsin activator domain-containing protein n=1 Tax=Halostagnicola sp. A-GB9-2 TaxID=3048066 RepID=UPI0024BFC3BF|nr:bacterio-opsin activator domain-containing protein [Halostagnicola sp. A-GB9-2]MDJ1433182.1 bacterio-opsin activator domain-containing protein [Halostagnicola sp. A-GB9-2]